MLSPTTQKGSTGENIACGYLAHIGYKIVGKNTRTKFGELDAIAISPDKTLVFVEVKTVFMDKMESGNSPASYPQESGNNVYKLCNQQTPRVDNFTAETHMNNEKIIKTKRMALWYANYHKDLSKHGYRIDLIAIDVINSEETANIRHYKNIS